MLGRLGCLEGWGGLGWLRGTKDVDIFETKEVFRGLRGLFLG